jgi:WD40 repeat protein
MREVSCSYQSLLVSLLNLYPLFSRYKTASISPDGRTLLSVGDSPHVHLTRLSGSSTVSCDPIASIDLPPTHHSSYAYSHSDHGYGYGNGASFSTAFSRDGSKYAVASQDGIVAVWDVRSSKPLKTWCTSPSSPSWSQSTSCPPWSVRCVAFSKGKGGKETMAFTEHSSGKVHVVDARTFETEQVVEVPTPTEVPAHVQHLLANRQTGMALYSGNTRREVDRIMPMEGHHRPFASLPSSFYGFGGEYEMDEDDMEIDAYPPVSTSQATRSRQNISPLRVSRRGPVRIPQRSPPSTSPEGLDLAGVCFDSSGAKMYVASTGSLTEWDVLGSEKRWFYDDGLID